MISVVQLLLMTGVVAILFLALRPLENRPLPGWDGAAAVNSVARGAAIGALLCVAGAATLVAIQSGLKDVGLYFEATTVAALIAARVLAADPEPR